MPHKSRKEESIKGPKRTSWQNTSLNYMIGMKSSIKPQCSAKLRKKPNIKELLWKKRN